MPRKSPQKPTVLSPARRKGALDEDGVDLMDVLASGMMDDIPQAVMELEMHTLDIAHEIAREAIRVSEFDSEDERVEAARRQARLILELRDQLTPDS